MRKYLTPEWVVWLILGVFILFCLFILFLIYLEYRRKKLDKIIFIDESNRWSMLSLKLNKSKMQYEKANYYLKHGSGLLNKHGKKLFIFSKDKPQPLKLSYNTHEWLSANSLTGAINNEYIQQFVRPTAPIKDMIMLFGAIGGMLSAIASVLVFAKIFGII